MEASEKKEHIRKKRALKYLFFTVFLDMLGVGILIPVIPELFANPASQYYLLSAQKSVNTGYLLLGLLTAVYPIAIFFAAPVLGQLSDKYGRKPVLALCLFGTGIGYVLFAIGILVRSIPLLFFARIFDGITGGNISVAQAAIADVTEPQDRAKNFGLIGLAFGLGFILGPALGGVLSNQHIVYWFSAQFPFFVAAGFAFLNTGLILKYFKETNIKLTQAKINLLESFQKIRSAKKYKPVRTLFIVAFFLSAGFAFFTSFFNVFLTHKFGFTQSRIGSFFAFIGLCTALTQGFVTRFIAHRFKDVQILSVTYFATALSVVLYLIPSKQIFLYFIVPLFAVSYGLTASNASAIVSRLAPSDAQGEVLGINAALVSLAQAFPPLLAGFLAALFSPGTPILFASALVIVAGIIFVASRKKHQ